jgi:hypothetical protein
MAKPKPYKTEVVTKQVKPKQPKRVTGAAGAAVKAVKPRPVTTPRRV